MKAVAVVLADIVDGADVGMIQSGSGFGFALEAFERLRVVGDIVGEKFQSDGAVEAGVLGFVDDTHAAATEFFDDAVVRNGAADKGLRVGHGGEFKVGG